MGLRFVHTGDLHLDSPFLGLGEAVPERISSALRDATLRSWERIVRLALDEQVDAVLVAGDVFEGANRTLRAQVAFRDGLERLARERIPSFVVTGNHDPLSGWEPAVAWPSLAWRFGAQEVTSRPILRDGVELARVHGISYAVRDVSRNLAATFRRDGDEPFAIGLLHANVGGIEGYGNYAPCSISDLLAGRLDYWALGHIHKHGLLRAKDPTIVYCGNPQGRDPGETEPRGCYLVDVDDAGHVKAEFRAMDVVRWQRLSVSIERIATEDELVLAVGDAIESAATQAGRSVVALTTLTGRGPMHASLRRTGVLRDLLDLVRQRFGAGEPFAWLETLRDQTRPSIDLAVRREAGDLLGEALREFDRSRMALREGQEADLHDLLADLYDHPRVRRALAGSQPGTAELLGLLDAAEAQVVDQLDESG
ncbi:MAG: metallophosphoesterase family protein [Candidatus Limnocylindrales bacterium]